jgi:predicted dienelactone hydrolase
LSVRRLVLVIALVLSLAGVAGARCRPDATMLARYESAGPLSVARTTLTVVDAGRPTQANRTFPGAPERTLTTEVWYPDPAAARPFPLVVVSHGFSGSRLSLTYLAQHLASHGYVVAAVDFPLSRGGAPGGPTVDDIEHQPGDLRVVIDRLLGLSATAGDVLAGTIDGERIGATGLSWGGLTTLLATYHRDFRDPRIRAALPIAAPACFTTRRFFRPSRAPLLLLYGDADLIVPMREHALTALHATRGPRLLVALTDAAHTGFSAFAAVLDPMPHYDVLACPLLIDALEGTWTEGGTPYADLATPGSGVAADAPRCPVPCAPDRIAAAPVASMAGDRQQMIVRAVATAFFDAWLRDDESARCALRKGVDATWPDVRVRSR